MPRRGKKAAINTIMYLIEEVVAVVCGFILPKLILSHFGSRYNGLTSSITQFLSCTVLLRAGIGGVTRAALYKPLASGDRNSISRIIKATDIFMKRIGLITLAMIVGFSVLYPFLVRDEFGWLFTCTLFLVIGASTLASTFFGITYSTLLWADQRLWITALLKSICYIANTVICVLLISQNAGIHVVKLGSAFVYVLYPIVQAVYVRKKYKIDTHVEPDNHAISQRWDAYFHQIAAFVMNNTDVIVLTIFGNLLEVSVYSVYNLILSGLKRVIAAFTNSLEPAFGNMLAQGETDLAAKNLRAVETIVYGLSTVIYACTAVLILDFVSIYTKGINDTNYLRPVFAFVIITAHYFNAARLPYFLMVQAAGHYRQTRNGAIMEPILNIVLSVIMVIKFGMVGVAIGTLAATLYRTVLYSIYVSRNIIIRSVWIAFGRIALSFAQAGIIYVVSSLMPFGACTNYGVWVVKAIFVGALALVTVFFTDLLVFKKDTLYTIGKLLGVVRRKGSKKKKAEPAA